MTGSNGSPAIAARPPHRPGIRAGAVAMLLAVVSAVSAAAPVRAAELTILPSDNGNIFVGAETPVFRVAAGRTPVRWRVFDLDGTVVRSGQTQIATDDTLAVPLHEPGYYRLALERAAPDGGPAEQVERGFVVLPAHQPGRGDRRFGVVTHFAHGWPQSILPSVARAGLAGIRDEQPWKLLEQQPQQFGVPAYLDHYVKAARRLDLDTLVALTFGNPLYDNGQTPFSEAGMAAYARYCREVVRHFGEQVPAVEVWNEFNGQFADGPVLSNRPLFYTGLLQQAAREIKRARPAETVVGGGAAGVPLRYFHQLFDYGALSEMDVVQIHPYRTIPEGVEYEVQDLREMIAAFNAGASKPIWATEAGIGPPKSREQAAEFLVRLITLLVSEQVDRVYWYLLRDYDHFVGMGLLEWDEGTGASSPALAYAAYATLSRMLAGRQFVRREPTDERTRIYLFARGGDDVRVAWAPTAPSTITVEAETAVSVIGLDGRELRVISPKGAASLPLTERPIFIVGKVTAITESRNDQLVTDSVDDFSSRQSERNWWYGSYGAADAAGSPARPGSHDFRTADIGKDKAIDRWADSRFPFLAVGRELMHPAMLGETPIPAVRRWRSDEDSTMRISGWVSREAENGDGVQLEIALDGAVVWSETIGGPGHAKSAEFDFDKPIHKGTTVDFVVWPGPTPDSNIDFDATMLRVEIVEPKNPADPAAKPGTQSKPARDTRGPP